MLMSSSPPADGASSRPPLVFRDDFREVIQAAVESRRGEWGTADKSGKLEILDDPAPDSPFMTLVDTRNEGLRSHVVKVLVLPPSDPSFPFWEDVLETGAARMEADARRRLDVRHGIERLELPLTLPEFETYRGQLGPFRGPALFANADERVAATVNIPYIARPYIPWPRLDEVGLDRGQRRRLWEKYREKVPFEVDDEEESLSRFCRVALVGTEQPTPEALFLISHWRFTPSPSVVESPPRVGFWRSIGSALRARLYRWRKRGSM
jgi:hypothetical protein